MPITQREVSRERVDDEGKGLAVVDTFTPGTHQARDVLGDGIVIHATP